MKGVIFNLLEEAVSTEFGSDTWETLLDDASLDGAYTSLGDYDDAHVKTLVAAAAARLSLTPGEVLMWFGQRAMPLLRDRYPTLFADHASSRSFVLSVNKIVHPEVRKLYSGTKCPFFHFREADDGSVLIRYESSRGLFDLAHGFVLGAAALWDDPVQVTRLAAPDGSVDSMVVRWGRP